MKYTIRIKEKFDVFFHSEIQIVNSVLKFKSFIRKCDEKKNKLAKYLSNTWKAFKVQIHSNIFIKPTRKVAK